MNETDTKIEYEKWLHFPCLTIYELVCLIQNVDPKEKEEANNAFLRFYYENDKLLQSCIDVGELKILDIDYHSRGISRYDPKGAKVKTIEFLQWAFNHNFIKNSQLSDLVIKKGNRQQGKEIKNKVVECAKKLLAKEPHLTKKQIASHDDVKKIVGISVYPTTIEKWLINVNPNNSRGRPPKK